MSGEDEESDGEVFGREREMVFYRERSDKMREKIALRYI